MTSTETARVLDDTPTSLETTHVVIEGTIDLLKRQIQKLENENSVLQKREEEIRLLREELSTQRDKVGKLETELAFNKSELIRSLGNNKLLEVRITSLTQQVDHLNEENSKTKQHCLEVNTQLLAERDKNRILKLELHQEQENTSNAKKKLVEALAEQRVIEYRHRSNLTKIEQDHFEQTKKLMEEVKELSYKLSESSEEVVRLRKAVDIQRQQISEQSELTDKLIAQVDELEYELNEMKNHNEGLQNTIDNLNRRVEELTKDKIRSNSLVKKLKEVLTRAQDITDLLEGHKTCSD
jgi:chromosome segregation ATPase